MPGIRTVVDGIAYRSRTEARWALFFKALEIDFEYEPCDLDGWIPDFALLGVVNVYVEVKSDLSRRELLRHVPKIARATDRETLLVGARPYLWDSDEFSGCALGLIVHIDDAWSQLGQVSDAIISQCRSCSKVGYFSATGSYQIRTCGHHDGDHHLNPCTTESVQALWNATQKRTQWKR